MGRAGGRLVAGGQSPTSVFVGGSRKKRLSREPAGVDCVISSVAIGQCWSSPYPPIDCLNPFSLDGGRFFTNSPLASHSKTHGHRLWRDLVHVCERPRELRGSTSQNSRCLLSSGQPRLSLMGTTLSPAPLLLSPSAH